MTSLHTPKWCIRQLLGRTQGTASANLMQLFSPPCQYVAFRPWLHVQKQGQGNGKVVPSLAGWGGSLSSRGQFNGFAPNPGPNPNQTRNKLLVVEDDQSCLARLRNPCVEHFTSRGMMKRTSPNLPAITAQILPYQ